MRCSDYDHWTFQTPMKQAAAMLDLMARRGVSVKEMDDGHLKFTPPKCDETGNSSSFLFEEELMHSMENFYFEMKKIVNSRMRVRRRRAARKK